MCLSLCPQVLHLGSIPWVGLYRTSLYSLIINTLGMMIFIGRIVANHVCNLDVKIADLEGYAKDFPRVSNEGLKLQNV